MAFHKTSIGISTHIVGSGHAHSAASTGRPESPSVGEVYEDMVWDGRAWVSLTVWESRQAASPGS